MILYRTKLERRFRIKSEGQPGFISSSKQEAIKKGRICKRFDPRTQLLEEIVIFEIEFEKPQRLIRKENFDLSHLINS